VENGILKPNGAEKYSMSAQTKRFGFKRDINKKAMPKAPILQADS
jgi:hypothetical protein